MNRLQRLQELHRSNDNKIVLLILDGLGDLRTRDQSQTPLEAAHSPHLDQLASEGALGRLTPAGVGITPGSGPGHLGLFGYDPLLPQHDIGRGVLEALGLGLKVPPGTLAARGNFATLDDGGRIVDRRAGRIPTSEGQRLIAKLRPALDQFRGDGLEVELHAGEGYRFVLLVRSTDGSALGAALDDTDPQRVGVPPLQATASDSEDEASANTAARLQPVIDSLAMVLNDEPKANGFTLRGFSSAPELVPFEQAYGVRAGAFAGYPLYRGVASACGMQVIETPKQFAGVVDTVAANWDRFDFFFLHVKQTDQAGEDGDFESKRDVIATVDRDLPRLVELGPEVLAVSGDHSTPAPMKAHSWHPVPLLVHAPFCGIDDSQRFDELEAARGGIGTLPSCDLMALLLANAGKLVKFGA